MSSGIKCKMRFPRLITIIKCFLNVRNLFSTDGDAHKQDSRPRCHQTVVEKSDPRVQLTDRICLVRDHVLRLLKVTLISRTAAHGVSGN